MDEFCNEMSGGVVEDKHRVQSNIRGQFTDESHLIGNTAGTKHTSVRVIKDPAIKENFKISLDGKPLAFEKLIKMNWLRVNFNLFEVNRILMLLYYNKEAITVGQGGRPSEERKAFK